MRPKPILSGIAKAAFLAAGAWLLIWAAKSKFGDPLPVIDDDDLRYDPLVKVHVATVTTRTMRAYTDVYGTVEPAPVRPGVPAASADVASPVTALVTAVNVAEGQHVSAGYRLFRLDDRDAEAAFVKATADRDAAKRLMEQVARTPIPDRDRLRFERDLAAAEAAVVRAAADRELRVIKAPIAGTVTRLSIHPGDVVTAATAAAQVVDLDRLVIALSVPAAVLPTINPGGSAEIIRDAGTSNPCDIVLVDPAVDPTTGQGSVDVSAKGLRLGESAHVRLVTAEHKDVLVVPAESIVEDVDGSSFVYTVEANVKRRFGQRRLVQTGLHDGGFIEVSSTELKFGTKVVRTGAFGLTDKCRIDPVDEPTTRNDPAPADKEPRTEGTSALSGLRRLKTAYFGSTLRARLSCLVAYDPKVQL